MLRKHLVIVGGGWAGMKLVRQLKHVNHHDLRITLISNESNFRYSAALYRAATGHRERDAIIPLGEILLDLPNVKFIKATAKSIDRQKREIKTSDGQTFHYDYAVLALGVVTSFFGIPGLAERAYSIKTAIELRRLRTHLHQELIDEQAPDKNYMVVGAGPTGVELSAAMCSYIKQICHKHGIKHRRISIELVEAAPRVLPLSHPRISKKAVARLRSLGVKVLLNQKVESETADCLVVNGRHIPTHTVIWTAGIINNPFYTNNSSQFSFNERGKIIVNDHLRVDDRVYVIGDNAATQYSGLGLTAVHNARYVGLDIQKRLKGKANTRVYKPLRPVGVVPVGPRWAVFEYRRITIGGFLASIIRAFADLIAYSDVIGLFNATKIWLTSVKHEEVCGICRSTLEHDHEWLIASKQVH